MDSPCVSICVIDPTTGLCEGCARSLAEIAGWSTMTSAERCRIMAGLEGRKAKKEGVI